MMKIDRRAALALLAGLAATTVSGPASALAITDYSDDSLPKLEAWGKPYLLDFYASWCVTCAAQQRVLDSLIKADPRYASILIVRVDWDKYGRGELVQRMAIPRRSTLVMMRGATELGRLVAETREDKIAALLELGVS
ncbi:thioredoxin family protein [Devosia beringensis]|uniref:thioredoxin family protein n=1 Tax=Devosia beringensis TaxID=2657486 RepID=UPI001AEDB1F6|nr:thioredoxin family protein [Devosia beringensis]